jgi:excisionase family DNA binding protein
VKTRRPKTPKTITPTSVLTTGQVAKIIQCAPRTITKLIDAGKLKGHRLPGTDDRRVFAADLYNFLTAHDYPCPPELCPPELNIAFGVMPEDVPENPKFRLHDSPVNFGAAVRHAPALDVALVGDGQGMSFALAAAACCRNWHPRSKVVLLVSEGHGFVECLDADVVAYRPADVGHLVAQLVFPKPAQENDSWPALAKSC